MKQDTLDILRKDITKGLKNNKRIQRNIEERGYTYEVEYIPILVERTNEGKCGEITYPQSRLIYQCENYY